MIVANYHLNTIDVPLPVQRQTASNKYGCANLLTHTFLPQLALTWIRISAFTQKPFAVVNFAFGAKNVPKTV